MCPGRSVSTLLVTVTSILTCILVSKIEQQRLAHPELISGRAIQYYTLCRVKTECDGTSAETRFVLPAKRTSPFISAGVAVQSSTGFLGVPVNLKTAGYPLQSPLSPSLLLPCVAVCHQIPFPLYN